MKNLKLNKTDSSSETKLTWEPPSLVNFAHKTNLAGACQPGSGDGSDCSAGNNASSTCNAGTNVT